MQVCKKTLALQKFTVSAEFKTLKKNRHYLLSPKTWYFNSERTFQWQKKTKPTNMHQYCVCRRETKTSRLQHEHFSSLPVKIQHISVLLLQQLLYYNRESGQIRTSIPWNRSVGGDEGHTISLATVPHYTVHCTLYTTQFTLYTLHWTLDTGHCTLHTLHFTLYTGHWTLYTTHFTLYNVQCTLHYTKLY